MTFDEMFYLQIQGTAMGTIFAPTYATLSMGFHETELYTIIRNKFTLWKKDLYGYLFKTNELKKICLLQIKPPQALLEKYPIFTSS